MIDDLPDGLLNFLQSEENRAEDTSLNEERAVAIDFYNGEPFGDEEDGRSQLVTRDVAEVIDYMTVSILRTIVSGKRVVEFEARHGEHKQAAEDATELVQWQFMREQPGYQILHDALKAGLLEKSGVVKTWAEPSVQVVEGTATAAEVDGDDSVVSFEPIDGAVEVAVDPLTGEEFATQVYNVRRKVPGPFKFRDAAVPNEEFRVSPEARSLDEAAYIQHRTRKTLSWIAEQDWGITDEVLDTLWSEGAASQHLSNARDAGRARLDSESGYEGRNRHVWLTEEHIRWDLDGDGVPERICVFRVGSKVLHIEETDEQPFVLWTPFPMQHRLIGQSLADKTMDIQRVRSVLLRQAMDALYYANSPRIAVNMDNPDPNTLDDVLTIIPGAPIRYRGVVPPQPMAMPFAAPNAFQALEFMAGERESRTGITRLNQGLDADALNKTATGTAMMQAQGQQIEEYLARNFAEMVSELFEKKLRLMQKFGSPVSLRVGGEFKEIDPTKLEGDMDMAVIVGLGSGRKDQRLGHRMTVLEMQKEAMANGLDLVDDDKLYNSVAGFIEDAGLGDVNSYFNDPNAEELDAEGNPLPKQPKPEPRDPAEIEAEGKAAAAMAKVQQDGELERMRLEAQIANDRARAEFEAELARDKAAFEARMATERWEFERTMAGIQAATIPQNRPGGSLAA